MANNSAFSFRFAGVAQQPERRVSSPEVGGKNPPPRSTVYLLPQPQQPDTSPLVVVMVTALAGCALCLIGLAGYAGWIVWGGLP